MTKGKKAENTVPIDVRVLPSDVKRIDAYAARLTKERGSKVSRSGAARELIHVALNATTPKAEG